mgnify:CR=1 FL=1|tara:strand:+ start:2829 stop:3143 length:315 start_codon:yes stop_codon:yes gene_type:complete
MFWGVRWGINKDFSLSQPIKKGGKVGKLGERWGKSNTIQAQKEGRKEGRERATERQRSPTINGQRNRESRGESSRGAGEQGKKPKQLEQKKLKGEGGVDFEITS